MACLSPINVKGMKMCVRVQEILCEDNSTWKRLELSSMSVKENRLKPQPDDKWKTDI